MWNNEQPHHIELGHLPIMWRYCWFSWWLELSGRIIIQSIRAVFTVTITLRVYRKDACIVSKNRRLCSRLAHRDCVQAIVDIAAPREERNRAFPSRYTNEPSLLKTYNHSRYITASSSSTENPGLSIRWTRGNWRKLFDRCQNIT